MGRRAWGASPCLRTPFMLPGPATLGCSLSHACSLGHRLSRAAALLGRPYEQRSVPLGWPASGPVSPSLASLS